MAGGISTPTQRNLAADPDLDQSLYSKPVPAEAVSQALRKKFYTPAGKTQEQIASEQAAAAEAYQKYKNQPRRR